MLLPKTEEQDRLKALDTSIVNLEKDWGGKPDVAIEVLRQERLERQELKDRMHSRKSTKALLRTAIAAREKVVIKLDGLQKEEVDLTQLSLLKQAGDRGRKERRRREGAGGRDAAGETSSRGRLRWVLLSCFFFFFLLLATVTAAVRSRTGGVAPRGRSNQVRGLVFQHQFQAQGIRAPLFGGSEPGVSCDSTASGSCFHDADRDDISGIQLPCCQSSFLPRSGLCVAGLQTSQESGAAAGSRADFECIRQATAGGRASRTSVLWTSARATADPAEQAFEVCTMADFSRRVPLDELRCRGLMKGLQPEILEQEPKWPLAQAAVCEACTQLIAYTDGSACMTRAWPRLAAEAGWGAVIIVIITRQESGA